MRQRDFMSVFLTGVFALALSMPGRAQAMTFDRIVVFGGSLSDSGNVFALNGGLANHPPYDQIDPVTLIPLIDPNSLIPNAPYDVGGHHFSNGATWIEQFARGLGLGASTRPALAEVEGTDYAVGAARAREDDVWGSSFQGMSMTKQVGTFREDFDDLAPSDALYVIDFGGNDVRDAVLAYNAEGIGAVNDLFEAAIKSIASNIQLLYGIGAKKFLVLNVADIGNIPSIILADQEFPGIAFLAKTLSHTFNDNLETTLASLEKLPGIEIARFDVFTKVDAVIDNPGAFGFTYSSTACIRPNEAPFRCDRPDEYLFWDGIHPTKAGHSFLAQTAADILTPVIAKKEGL